jgi:hypothetical protein
MPIQRDKNEQQQQQQVLKRCVAPGIVANLLRIS